MERFYLEAAALMGAGANPNQVRAGLSQQLSGSGEEQFWKIWDFAVAVGAPLAETLQQQAEIERSLRLARDRLAKLSVAPKSTFRLVAVLPFIALASAQLGGLNPIGAFKNSWVPWLAVIIGILLLFCTQFVSSRLLSRAAPKAIEISLPVRLFLIAASAGHATAKCYALVESHLGEGGQASWMPELRRSLDRADRFGATPLTLVRSELSIELERIENERAIALERTSIRLIAPAALLSMPAFALIALVPTALGLAMNLNS